MTASFDESKKAVISMHPKVMEITVQWYPTERQMQNLAKLCCSVEPFRMKDHDLGITHLKGWFYLRSAQLPPWGIFYQEPATATLLPTEKPKS